MSLLSFCLAAVRQRKQFYMPIAMDALRFSAMEKSHYAIKFWMK